MPTRFRTDEVPPGHEVRRWHTGTDLTQHVRLIHRQVLVSLEDQGIHHLAGQLVNGEHRMHRGKAYVAYRRRGHDPIWLEAPGVEKGRIGYASDDWAEALRRSFAMVKRNTAYAFDPHRVDRFASAGVTIIERRGDCDDHTIFHDSVNAALGFRVGCEVISEDGEAYSHVYALVGTPPGARDADIEWVPLDTAAPPQYSRHMVPGWRYPHFVGEPRQYEFGLDAGGRT